MIFNDCHTTWLEKILYDHKGLFMFHQMAELLHETIHKIVLPYQHALIRFAYDAIKKQQKLYDIHEADFKA